MAKRKRYRLRSASTSYEAGHRYFLRSITKKKAPKKVSTVPKVPAKNVKAAAVRSGVRRMVVIIPIIEQIQALQKQNSNNDTDDDGAIAAGIEAALVADGEIEDAEEDIQNLDPEEAAKRWKLEKGGEFSHLFPRKNSVDGKSSAVHEKEKEKEKRKEKAEKAKKNAEILMVSNEVTNGGTNRNNGMTSCGPKTEPRPPNKPGVPQFVIVSGDRCSFCNHICGRFSPLQRHLARHHQFRCETCTLEFGTKVELKKHQDKHRSRYRCDLCEKDYHTFNVFKRHLKGKLHEILSRAQSKLFNEMVKKLKLDQSHNLKLLDARNDTEIYCGRKIKEESHAGSATSNVKIFKSSIVEFVYEHAETGEFITDSSRIHRQFTTDSGFSTYSEMSDPPETEMNTTQIAPLTLGQPLVPNQEEMTVAQEFAFEDAMISQEYNPVIQTLQPNFNPSMLAMRAAFMNDMEYRCESIEMSAIAQMISGNYDADEGVQPLEPLQSTLNDQQLLDNGILEPLEPTLNEQPVFDNGNVEPLEPMLDPQTILEMGKNRILEQVTQALNFADEDVQRLAFDADVLDRPPTRIALDRSTTAFFGADILDRPPSGIALDHSATAFFDADILDGAPSEIDLAEIEADSEIQGINVEAVNALMAKIPPPTTLTVEELDELSTDCDKSIQTNIFNGMDPNEALVNNALVCDSALLSEVNMVEEEDGFMSSFSFFSDV